MEPMEPMGQCTFCAVSWHTSPHELRRLPLPSERPDRPLPSGHPLGTAGSPTSLRSSARNSMNASPRRTEPTPHKMAHHPARCRRHPSAPSRWLSAATPPELMPKTTHPEGVAALARFQPNQGKSRPSRCEKWSRFTQRPCPEAAADQGLPDEEKAADLRCLKPP